MGAAINIVFKCSYFFYFPLYARTLLVVHANISVAALSYAPKGGKA